MVPVKLLKPPRPNKPLLPTSSVLPAALLSSTPPKLTVVSVALVETSGPELFLSPAVVPARFRFKVPLVSSMVPVLVIPVKVLSPISVL